MAPPKHLWSGDWERESGARGTPEPFDGPSIPDPPPPASLARPPAVARPVVPVRTAPRLAVLARHWGEIRRTMIAIGVTVLIGLVVGAAVAAIGRADAGPLLPPAGHLHSHPGP